MGKEKSKSPFKKFLKENPKYGEPKKRGIVLETINWDQMYITDIINGNGFDVTEGIYSKRGTEKNMNGLQSPRFGADWSDEKGYDNKYSCECGYLNGIIYNGETCPKCKTKIDVRKVQLNITAWISLHNYYIIHPIYYRKLESMLSKAKLEEIIKRPEAIDKFGDLVYDESKPYAGIGIMGFKEKFDDIMESVYSKKGFKKIELYKDIMNNKEKVFVSHIPLYSSVARPTINKDGKYTYNTIDKIYSPIFSMSKLLKNYEPGQIIVRRNRHMEISDILYQIQEDLMEAWEIICEDIAHKEGIIKRDILGGMINYSARTVIIPDPTLRSDEIRMNYHAVLELYKYDIIAQLARISKISVYDAKYEWFTARLKFNPRIYAIMNDIIKYKNKMIINRPPTINVGSLLCVKIVSITCDEDGDYTMSIPISILDPMNADFDGDMLINIRLVEDEIEEAYWRGFNPRKNLYISNNDGMFNGEMMLNKEQLVGLYEFANI